MSNRVLVVLGAVLAVLLGVAAVVMSGGSGGSSSPSGGVDLSQYTASATDAVSMGRTGQKPVLLEKIDGAWKVAGKAVHADNVKRLFDAFDQVDGGTLASRNKKNHEKMGATAAVGVTLIITVDGKKHTFIVGNPADAGGSFYIKEEGDDRVYQVESDEMMVLIGMDAKGWQTAPVDPNAQPAPGGIPGMPGGPGEALPPGAAPAPS